MWLTSLTMWFTCLRWLPAEGVTVEELRRRARTATNLDGMRRWGYVTIQRPPGAPAGEKHPDGAVIVPTRRGRAAQSVWKTTPAEVEDRWRERFGGDAIDGLRAPLVAIAQRIDPPLPDCMPIVGYGLFCRRHRARPLGPPAARDDAARARDPSLGLISLLARPLLGLALAFEQNPEVSLATFADVLAELDGDGVGLRELPQRTGVARPAVDMALTVLGSGGWAQLEPRADGVRGQQARLTPAGLALQRTARMRLATVEAAFDDRFDADAVALRTGLEAIAGDGTRDGSPLFAGLTPPADGWRAAVPPPARLPRFSDGPAPRRLSRRQLT